MTAKTLYSGVALASAVFIAIFAIYIEPMGIIDTSVLYVVAQLLIYSASLMGISSAVATILSAIKDIKQNQPKINAQN